MSDPTDVKRIPIFFTFDDNYVKPAAVAFFSLLDRARSGVFYEMYVLHHDISEANRRLLLDVVASRPRGRIEFIDTGDFLLDEWKNGNWASNQQTHQFTADAVVRCFAARFFPRYDRIIYSDVDVIFADDVSELWDVDLDGAYLAGVRSALAKIPPSSISHLKPEHFALLKDRYLFGGIWIMNLRKIREDALEDRMLEIIRDDTIVKRWNDQDVMNIACAGRVRFLSLRYVALPFLPEAMSRPGFESCYTRDELYDSMMRPKILHYAASKPWSADVSRGDEWWAIADYLRLGLSRPLRLPTGPSAAEFKKLRRAKRIWRGLFFLALTFALALLVAAQV